MLNNSTEEIRECLRRAEQCAREASELSDGSAFRQDFLELQSRWLELARSIEFGELLDCFTKSIPKRNPAKARRIAANIAKLPVLLRKSD